MDERKRAADKYDGEKKGEDPMHDQGAENSGPVFFRGDGNRSQRPDMNAEIRQGPGVHGNHRKDDKKAEFLLGAKTRGENGRQKSGHKADGFAYARDRYFFF